jgi:hypothetical protein
MQVLYTFIPIFFIGRKSIDPMQQAKEWVNHEDPPGFRIADFGIKGKRFC